MSLSLKKREDKFALLCWIGLIICVPLWTYGIVELSMPARAHANPDYADNLNRIVREMQTHNDLLEKQNRLLNEQINVFKSWNKDKK